MTKQKWKFFQVHRKDKRRFSEKIMYTQSYFRYRYSTEEAGCHFLENDKKKWVELGGISHTRKKKKTQTQTNHKNKKLKQKNVNIMMLEYIYIDTKYYSLM